MSPAADAPAVTAVAATPVADAAAEEARLRTAAYRELLCAEYEIACAVSDARGRPPPAYPSQVVKANEILAAFAEDVSLVTFVASPQWGKTGVILYLTYALAGLPIGRGVPEALAARPVDPEQVYIFTGMSDTDWTRQTKSRMLPSLAECVTHRNGIPAMFARRAAPGAGGLRDALIILDECHLASESSQTLSDALRRIGVLDYGALRERNIRILCISATPVHMLLDATGWGSVASRTVIATEGDGYLSFADLLAEDRVRDAASVQQDELIAFVQERWGDDDPKYHIVRQIDRRAPTAAASIASAINSAAAAASTVGVAAGAAATPEIVRKFSAAAFRAAGFAVSNHNSASRLGDVDELLKRRPDRHHVIFIKGFWRASKTFPDDHIGVCYESASDHTTILQGLAGRLLGHGKKRGPRAPFLFCDPEPIRSYNDWLASGCDYRTYAAYRSRLLKIAKGQVLKKRESTVHPNVVAGLPEPDGAPGAAAAANPAAPAMPRGPSLARVGEVSPAAARGPATFAATTMTVYATRAAFLEAIGVPEALRPGPDEWPARAQDLSALLKISRALASLNVSYNDNSARDVSNLLNYGSASRAKSWASADTQVIWIKERDPEEVIVIRKDLAGLQRALAEDAADPARTRRVVAHNYLKRTILYEIVR